MPKSIKQEIIAKPDEKEIQENIDYAVRMMRSLLQVIGLWPYLTYPNILRILLIAGISFLLIFVIVIPLALFILIVATDFQKPLQHFIERITNDWRSVCSRMEEHLMLESAKYANSFSIICVTCTYMGGMSYGTFFSFVMDPIEIDNKTVRILTLPSYFHFFNPNDYFKYIYTIHLVCIFTLFTITLAAESIGIACVMHVCGQINVISWMLHNLAAETFDKVTFGQIIEKHLRAMALAEKLEKFLNSMCFVEFIGCSFNMCMLGYYMITYRSQNLVLFGTYCLLFVSFTFNIFIFCYIGEQLTEKCGNIGSAAYNVDWYRLPVKDAKYFLMTVMSTKRPVVLTAGKMTTLSMASFSSVMKASFSYLNMLRTVA